LGEISTKSKRKVVQKGEYSPAWKWGATGENHIGLRTAERGGRRAVNGRRADGEENISQIGQGDRRGGGRSTTRFWDWEVERKALDVY